MPGWHAGVQSKQNIVQRILFSLIELLHKGKSAEFENLFSFNFEHILRVPSFFIQESDQGQPGRKWKIDHLKKDRVFF